MSAAAALAVASPRVERPPMPVLHDPRAVEAVIDDVAAGLAVVLFDGRDPDRGGSLIAGAQLVTGAMVNFMARHGRGVPSLCLTAERCENLGLRPMRASRDREPTNMMVTIEAREGVTTGISAADRARTISTAVDPQSGPGSLVTPGHIVPLRARPGGVLEHAGAVEGAVDLARAAGLSPAAVLCAILADDGRIATGEGLTAYCRSHGLRLIDVHVLAAYLSARAPVVERMVDTELDTLYGPFTAVGFREVGTGVTQVALVRGDVAGEGAVLVHAQEKCLLGDALASLGCDCKRRLERALAEAGRADRAVIVYLQADATDSLTCPAEQAWAGSPRPLVPQPAVVRSILSQLDVSAPRFLTDIDTPGHEVANR